MSWSCERYSYQRFQTILFRSKLKKMKRILLFASAIFFSQVTKSQIIPSSNNSYRPLMEYQFSIGAGATASTRNANSILQQNGYHAATPFQVNLGAGLIYPLSRSWDLGIFGAFGYGIGAPKSSSFFSTAELRVSYAIYNSPEWTILPSVGMGASLQRLFSSRSTSITDIDSLFLQPNGVQITNGWLTPTLGLDIWKNPKASSSMAIGLSFNYRFGLGKKSWGADFKDIRSEVSDAFHQVSLGIKIKNILF